MEGREPGGTGRAGRYVQQPVGYRAFLPAPLPPNPPLRMDDLQAPLAEASHALGRLDGSVLTLPDPDLFVLMYVRKEAVLSSQIEGTQSSLQDLLEAEARIFSPDRPADVREVTDFSAQATETARRILALRERRREQITQSFGRAAGNGLKVLEQLFRTPIISVKKVQTITKTEFPAANQLVQRLVQLGVLKEITGQARNRHFRFEEYVQLFAEGTEIPRETGK